MTTEQAGLSLSLRSRALALALAMLPVLAAGPGLVSIAAAQEPGAPAAATPAVNPVITPASNRSNGPLITPNYKDADLGQIVEAVSQVTGKNFIIDPRAKAQVTMLSATPMSPEAFYEAFLSILQVHGFVAVPSGRVWKIIPDANARQVPANDLPDNLAPLRSAIEHLRSFSSFFRRSCERSTRAARARAPLSSRC